MYNKRKFDYVNRLKFLNLLIEYIIYQIHFTSPQSPRNGELIKYDPQN